MVDKYYLLIVIAILITACSTPQLDLPQWVKNPQNAEGQLCAIGSGVNDRIATINAKASLAQTIQIHIANETTLKQNTNNSTFESIYYQQAEALITNTFITHNETIGEIVYLRLCVKSNHMKEVQ